MTQESIDLVHKNIAYQVKAGFCQIIEWSKLKENCSEHLKLLPVSVIPQVGRQGRIIIDLSFPVYKIGRSAKRKWKQQLMQKLVNSTTAPPAPEEA
eukprot:11504625-Ditylum_brightwellii.AAC.1